jgi:DNA-binding PucR family transcriptional regulator
MSGQPCRLAFVPIADDVSGLTLARRLNRLPANQDFLAAAAEAGGIMVLVEDRGVGQVRRTLARLLEGSGQEDARCGVSAVLTDPVGIPAALDEARSAARAGSGPGVTLYEDLGITGELLVQVGGDGAAAFVTRMLGPLVESDRQRGTALVASLDAYLRHRGSLRQAAADLQVHANTLQLRLTRAARLTGLDLHDPRQLGLLSVALGWKALLAEPGLTTASP